MVSSVLEEGAVGASDNTSLGAGAWDGGGSFSWQGIGASKDGGLLPQGGVAVVAAALGHGQC